MSARLENKKIYSLLKGIASNGLGVAALVFIGIIAYNNFTGSCPLSALPSRTATGEAPDRNKEMNPSNQAAPAFAMKNLAGEEIRLADLQDKVVILNFWATWCGPCRSEIPAFIKLQEAYKERGVEVIGVSLDDEDAEYVGKVAAGFGINYQVLMGTREVAEAYGPIQAIPMTVIIDRAGNVYSRHLGVMSFNNLEEKIKAIL
ncbi:MAG: TlpA disulfide reductase family protein [Acidobacteriota bacterium]